MNAEPSQSELTTTLHLGKIDADKSPSHHLDERLASLSEEDREVISQIQSSNSDKAMIVIARGAQTGSRFLISAEGATIGRSSESSIFLDDVTVSRSHAKISKVEQSFVLLDTGSLNGTYINNVSISEHVLSSGDEFQIGKFHLIFISSQ